MPFELHRKSETVPRASCASMTSSGMFSASLTNDVVQNSQRYRTMSSRSRSSLRMPPRTPQIHVTRAFDFKSRSCVAPQRRLQAWQRKRRTSKSFCSPCCIAFPNAVPAFNDIRRGFWPSSSHWSMLPWDDAMTQAIERIATPVYLRQLELVTEVSVACQS